MCIILINLYIPIIIHKIGCKYFMFKLKTMQFVKIKINLNISCKLLTLFAKKF